MDDWLPVKKESNIMSVQQINTNEISAEMPYKTQFVTVHGAGHEVPLYKPMEAFEMLKRYLNHSW